MVYVTFSWKGECVSAYYKNQEEAQEAFNWFKKHYLGAKIEKINEVKDNGTTKKELYFS